MLRKSPKLTFSKFFRCASAILLIAALIAAAVACSQSEPEPEATQPPVLTVAPTASPTPIPTPTPTPAPTTTPVPSVVSTPRPTPNIIFPPFETDSNGDYPFPQILKDKTSVMTGEPVYFKILTSNNVNSIQTIIDGETGKIYTEYEKLGENRVWRTKIHFTVGGTRKVQFKCAMASGVTVVIPKSRIRIEVTFDYTAESTSKTISKGMTVTFTLKTPDNIDTIYALVDGVNQNLAYTDPDSNEGGVKVWKLNITFFGLGNRSVTFEAHEGTREKATFPDPGISIIVQDSE
ncbi:MAG: hypothetical protein HN948_04400 [Clostridia bacterium]|nr:hypothetical protein [Clostridia bacterium]MBT7122230.1 hypothetical protein [Clostridia bacterium]